MSASGLTILLMPMPFSFTVTRFYAYANGLLAPAAGYEGRLTSPFFYASTDMCVEFFYHMYGTGVGTLTLNEKVGYMSSCIGLKNMGH